MAAESVAEVDVVLRERYYLPVLMPLSLPPIPPALDVADTTRLSQFEKALDGVLHDAREIVLGAARDALARQKPLGLDTDEGLAEVINELNRVVRAGGMTRIEAVYMLSVLASVVTAVDLEPANPD